MKDQLLLKHLRKCIQNYGLIDAGDRIAVGISGGKDSMLLVTGLHILKQFYPEPFDLVGITVDPGFQTDYSPAASYLAELGIPYRIVKTDIREIVFDAKKEDHPCSLCANMRRAALTEAAEQEHCNKLALGHHKDDFLATFLLSLLYEGRLYTFSPKTTYEDRRISVIRPLLYLSEGQIRSYIQGHGIPVVKNSCPEDGKTKRAEMTELLASLQKQYPELRDRLLHAIETSDIPDWKSLRRN